MICELSFSRKKGVPVSVSWRNENGLQKLKIGDEVSASYVCMVVSPGTVGKVTQFRETEPGLPPRCVEVWWKDTNRPMWMSLNEIRADGANRLERRGFRALQ